MSVEPYMARDCTTRYQKWPIMSQFCLVMCYVWSMFVLYCAVIVQHLPTRYASLMQGTYRQQDDLTQLLNVTLLHFRLNRRTTVAASTHG